MNGAPERCLAPCLWGRHGSGCTSVVEQGVSQDGTHLRPVTHSPGGEDALCEDVEVFQQMVDWVSGSNWSYLAVFGVAVLDAFFPLVPSESMVILAGALAGAGDLNVFLVIACAWSGAVAGDNVSYGIGKWAGEHTVKRLFSHEKAHAGFDWAEEQLEQRGSYIILVARFIPFGRTAVTFTSGYTKGLPWHRFFRYDLLAGGVWATYATMLGYVGGKQFEQQPWKGVLVGLGVAFTLAFVIELVRKRRAKRNPPAPAVSDTDA
jgi:membrane-associated protein